MRKIFKSPEPQSLSDFNSVHYTDWKQIHERGNQHVYEDCMTQCLFDQNGLCGYSEVRLNEDNQHIDHYVKRNLDPRLTFAWTNMVAAAKDSKFGADWKDDHIAQAGVYDNATQSYANLLNPVNDEMEGRFRFSTDGKIEPVDDTDDLARNTIKVFNLNEPSLKNRRKNCMQMARAMLNGGMQKEDILGTLSSEGFVSAIEYELSFA